MRGKILRDTSTGTGIVFINGEQKPFKLEQHWRSSTAPLVNQTVDVELAASGAIANLTVVDETALAKEQAQRVAGQAAVQVRQLSNHLLATVGPISLGSVLLLLLSWTWFNFVTISISQGYSEGASLYDVLKLANAGEGLSAMGGFKHASSGMYGWVMWAAAILPLLPYFFKHKLAWLANFAPLAFMVTVAYAIYSAIQKQVSTASSIGGMFGGVQAQQMAQKMASEMVNAALHAMSLGLGFYISAVIAIYFCYIGITSKKGINP